MENENQEKDDRSNRTVSENAAKYTADNLDNPGTLKKAKEHGSAQKIYDIPREFLAEKVEFCECCQLPIETKDIIKPFPFCVDIRELSNCGTGTFLYFYFFKYILFCLFVCVGMCAIPTIIISKTYSNDLINFCNKTTINYTLCDRYKSDQIFNQTDWLYQMSYENLNKTILLMNNISSNGKNHMLNFSDNVVDYNFINFLTMIILLVTNWFFLVAVNNFVREADYTQVTPSDFTLMISSVKGDFKDADDLKNGVLEMDNLIPYDVNLTFSLDEYFILKKSITDKKKKYKYCKTNKRDTFQSGCLFKTIETKEELKVSIFQLKDQIKNYFKKVDNFSENKEIFTEVVFASFKDYVDYKAYYDHFPHSLIGSFFKYLHYLFAHYIFCCCYNKNKKKVLERSINLGVVEAPEPADVIWENLQYGRGNQFWRETFVYSLSFLLIIISFGIILGLNYVQWVTQSNGYYNSLVLKYIMSILISTTVTIINNVMSSWMTSLTNLEKVHSMTKYYLSLSRKLTIFTFLNSAIVPLISNVINYGWTSKDILINNLLIIFLSNSFVFPLTSLSNIPYIMKKITRASLEKKFKDDEPIENMTQRELNEIYENPDLQISYKYSYIAKTFLMSVFYLPLFPLGVFISIIGIAFTYLVEKFNLTRIYRRPAMLNSQICLFYMNYFKFMIFTYSVGNWIFLKDVYSSSPWAIISIIVFGSLIIIPIHIIFTCDCVGLKEEDILTKHYIEYYFDFNTDYHRQNPVTKKKGNQIYLERMKEQKIITDEMYEDLSEKMLKESVNMIELYYRTNANIQLKTKEQISSIFRPKAKEKMTGNKLGIGLLKNVLGDDFINTNDKKIMKTRTKALNNLINFGVQNDYRFDINEVSINSKKKKVNFYQKYTNKKEVNKSEEVVLNHSHVNYEVYQENNNFISNQQGGLVQNDNNNNVDVSYNNMNNGNLNIPTGFVHGNYNNEAPYANTNIIISSPGYINNCPVNLNVQLNGNVNPEINNQSYQHKEEIPEENENFNKNEEKKINYYD